MGRPKMFHPAAYLERIGFQGSTKSTAETLTSLNRTHLLAIPLENLDILLSREILFGEVSVYENIVEERRILPRTVRAQEMPAWHDKKG